MAASGTIRIIQGEDFTLNLAFANQDNSPYDLTGCTVQLLVRRDARSDAIISKTITDFGAPTTGLASLYLADVDTDIAVRNWQFQVVLVDALGEDRPSAVGYFIVTRQGVPSNSASVQIGSANISISITLSAGALSKASIGLGNVDNTSDLNKPVSVAMQQALDAKLGLGGDIGGTPQSARVISAHMLAAGFEMTDSAATVWNVTINPDGSLNTAAVGVAPVITAVGANAALTLLGP